MPFDRSTAGLVLRLARIRFLVPGILLYCLGVTFALARGSPFDIGKFFFGYSIFGLAHLSVSFSNDYFDREGDAYGTPNEVSGGSGVLVQHPELAPLALRLALGLLIASGVTALSFYLFYGYNPEFLLFAILGGWLGFFYSAPPFRLAWRGWGEITTAIAAGLVMPGLGYLIFFGSIDAWFLTLSLPLMVYGLFFIVSVEMPDMDADKKAGKRNAVSIYGLKVGERICLICAILGTGAFLLLWEGGWLGTDINFLWIAIISSIPLVIASIGISRKAPDQHEVINMAKMNFGSLMVFLILVQAMIVLLKM